MADFTNRDDFDALVRQCAQQIYNLALRLTGNPADAEDLAQESFIKAYKNIAKFEQNCSFSTWIYTITINLWKNKIRYAKRHSVLSFFSLDKLIETKDGEISREIPDGTPDPITEIEQNQKNKSVNEVLSRLDEDSKMIIIMRDIENRSYEEISALINCPLGTVKSRLARARETLRKKFIEHSKDEENGL